MARIPAPSKSCPLLALSQLHLEALEAGEVLADHAHDGVEVVGQCHSGHLLALVKTNQ